MTQSMVTELGLSKKLLVRKASRRILLIQLRLTDNRSIFLETINPNRGYFNPLVLAKTRIKLPSNWYPEAIVAVKSGGVLNLHFLGKELVSLNVGC